MHRKCIHQKKQNRIGNIYFVICQVHNRDKLKIVPCMTLYMCYDIEHAYVKRVDIEY